MLDIALLSTHEALVRLRPEWLRLFAASATRNPFAHPDWLIAWARHFVRPDDLYVLAVRRGGELVGIAPFYRRAVPFGPRVTALRPLGRDRASYVTELPQVLTAPGEGRRVLRAVVGHLCTEAEGWDWAELTLAPEQGWFEHEWIPRSGPGSGCVVMHHDTRAFVILPLPPSWDELRHGLKRNVKESIRRGSNRLAREGHEWRLTEPDGSPESLTHALATLVDLHRARAEMPGTEPHPDQFRDPRQEAFLRDVLPTLCADGCVVPLALEVDGEPVASRLVLECGDSTFFSLSGAHPRWWHYNVGTTLLALALGRAIDRGCVTANLSHGPDVSKLRWSEELHYAQAFVLVGERLRSRLAFAAFWHLRAEYLRRDERGRQLLGRRRPGLGAQVLLAP